MLNSQKYLEYFNERSTRDDGYGEDYYGVAGVDDQANANWQDGCAPSAR